MIKTWFSKHCDPKLRPATNLVRKAKHEQAFWQHRYWEHQLRDENDFARHVDYIHYNPVKHGLVSSPMAWPYSSFSRYVVAGIYPPDWGNDVINLEGIGHE